MRIRLFLNDNPSKQCGVTLLETMFALAIGILILLMATMYYSSTANNAKMVMTTKMVGDISEAVRAYAQSPNYKPDPNGSFTLQTLRNTGLLPYNETRNPWFGVLKVSTSGNYMGIQFFNVPSAGQEQGTTTKVGGICATLATQLSNSLPLPSPGTVALNGTTYTFSNPGGPYYVQVTKPNGSGGNIVVAQSKGAAVCQFSGGAAASDYSTATLSVVLDLS